MKKKSHHIFSTLLVILLLLSVSANGYLLGEMLSLKKEIKGQEVKKSIEETEKISEESQEEEEEEEIEEPVEQEDASTEVSETPDNFELFTSEEYGFQVSKPKEWTTQDCTYNNREYRLNEYSIGFAVGERCPFIDDIENVPPSFTIALDKTGNNDNYLPELFEKCKNNNDSEIIDIDGTEACRLEFINEMGNGYVIQIFFETEDYIWTIYGESTDFSDLDTENAEKYYDDYLKIFNNILETFKFI